jgi:hypothetical protein
MPVLSACPTLPEGKRRRGRDGGEETEGKTQRGRDRGEEIEGKR